MFIVCIEAWISSPKMPFDFSAFCEAVTNADEGISCSFTSLSGSSGALFFSMLSGAGIAISASEERARAFYSDCIFWSQFLDRTPPLMLSTGEDPKHFQDIAALYLHAPSKIIASVDASLTPLWPIDSAPLTGLSRGDTLNRDSFIRTLFRQGYHSVPAVSGEGEMSLRGGILDIFPPTSHAPVRIEFFGDHVESLRLFDIDTQLSLGETSSVWLFPVHAPSEGPTLIDLFPQYRMLFLEPDSIRKHNPDARFTPEDKKILTVTELPLEGEDFLFDVKGIAGLGLMKNEWASMEAFVARINEIRRGMFVLLACSSKWQAMRIKDLFRDQNTDIPVITCSKELNQEYTAAIMIGELSRGFISRNSIVLSGRDIFGQRPTYRAMRKSKVSKLISSIEDFQKGDYLVHVEHGIGKFLGIKKEKMEEYEGDFITIEYQHGDRLFVPLERIHLIQKYHATEGAEPKIDKLGGTTWKRTRQKVKKKIKDMAEKLIRIYAKRSTSQGTAFSPDTELHREFDGFFPYEETPDQIHSINEIKRDMEDPRPMDRLLCGDVGYGKTEVVMRACFKAVYDAHQVAVLVPTTILAEQHYETFTSRFSGFPVTIDYLSRFKTASEQKQTLRKLAEGQIDILIGTHRLLGKDVHFANLGFLVIDEEHKFGVRHKEKIKALKANVDILTLSATPIPRTLHMALSGIRCMSTIETPPEDRLAVQSNVARFKPSLIKEAIEKELDRGGQAFFVHNRVEDIYHIADFLRGLIPWCSIGVAHGQMKERELESVMKSFFHKKIALLVSTAIIGSGLDIPSANTIIINRADRFGLADLYQLRGRVGRSDIKAYAYFLIPGEDIISEEARKKLHAIQELGYLGAGFRLALKDLEIRGSGNLLGAEQSGHIEAVGFDMYMNMLETAVSELKGEKVPDKREPAVDMRVTAIIPEEYIENPEIRLSIYRKIASAKSINALDGIRAELKDRFGTPPEKTERLMDIMVLKVMARNLSVEKIKNCEGKVRIYFAPGANLDPGTLVSLYHSTQNYLTFLPEEGIELNCGGKKWHDMFREIKSVLGKLEIST